MHTTNDTLNLLTQLGQKLNLFGLPAYHPALRQFCLLLAPGLLNRTITLPDITDTLNHLGIHNNGYQLTDFQTHCLIISTLALPTPTQTRKPPRNLTTDYRQIMTPHLTYQPRHR